VDALGDTLRSLAAKLQPDGIELIIGGGYGLVLRARQLQAARRTGRYGLPITFRSTDDIDCFLNADIITDGAKTEKIANALHELEFTARVPHFIFERVIEIGGQPQTLEIDLLAADVAPDRASLVNRTDGRRIRPKTFGDLHARLTPEAVTIERGATRIDIGVEGHPVFVIIPHPVSFVLMKLFAFRDRIASPDPEISQDAPYHAFDLFLVLGSIDAAEWEEGQSILADGAAEKIVSEARSIVTEYFNDEFATGVVRLVEYANSKQGVRIPLESALQFVRDLADLFAVPRTINAQVR
jgi:hypothetical protein